MLVNYAKMLRNGHQIANVNARLSECKISSEERSVFRATKNNTVLYKFQILNTTFVGEDTETPYVRIGLLTLKYNPKYLIIHHNKKIYIIHMTNEIYELIDEKIRFSSNQNKKIGLFKSYFDHVLYNDYCIGEFDLSDENENVWIDIMKCMYRFHDSQQFDHEENTYMKSVTNRDDNTNLIKFTTFIRGNTKVIKYDDDTIQIYTHRTHVNNIGDEMSDLTEILSML